MQPVATLRLLTGHVWVSHGGFTVAFMGPSGRGKSTVAAALNRRGFGVVADDIVAVDCNGAYPMVVPGSAHMRLAPEAACALGWTSSFCWASNPLQEKWIVRNGSGLTAHAPVPLSLLCEVLPGDAAGLEELSPPEALVSIVANGYMGHSVLFKPDTAATHFQRCVRLCKHVRVLRLTRGCSFDQLNRVLDELVECNA